MSTNRQTATTEGDQPMNTNRQTAIKESKMKITTPKLIRWAGLSAMAAGIIFAGIQPIHPPDVLASVNTSAFIIITSFKTVMCIFGLFGIAGLYARQVEETGWLGLAGYLLLTIFYAVQMCFSFVEPLILPLLATVAPKFVESILGMASGAGGPMNLGAFATVYSARNGTVFARPPAVWHRDLPRPHPAALGGCPACLIGAFGDHHGCAASAPARAVGGDADGDRSGLAGICALV